MHDCGLFCVAVQLQADKVATRFQQQFATLMDSVLDIPCMRHKFKQMLDWHVRGEEASL